jgi:hypothetical protein
MISDRILHLSKKIFPATVLLLFISIAVNAQLVQLNLSFQKDTIRIGEQTALRLEIINQKNVLVQAFPLRDSLNKEIEIIDSLKNSGPESNSLTLQVTSFKSGLYKVSQIPLVFTYGNTTDTIFSQEIWLTVIAPVVNNQADIKDIKPVLNLPFRLGEILTETGIVLLILVILVIGGILLYRRLYKRKTIEEIVKALPPHVIALSELDKIKDEKLWQNGKIKEYYSRLSDTMRMYLENRFNIPSMEFVSSETMQSFRKTMPQEETLIQMLESILLTADTVKFAKGDPLPAENQGNLDNAYLFISQTKIVEVSIPEEKANELKSGNQEPENLQS